MQAQTRKRRALSRSAHLSIPAKAIMCYGERLNCGTHLIGAVLASTRLRADRASCQPRFLDVGTLSKLEWAETRRTTSSESDR